MHAGVDAHCDSHCPHQDTAGVRVAWARRVRGEVFTARDAPRSTIPICAAQARGTAEDNTVLPRMAKKSWNVTYLDLEDVATTPLARVGERDLSIRSGGGECQIDTAAHCVPRTPRERGRRLGHRKGGAWRARARVYVWQVGHRCAR